MQGALDARGPPAFSHGSHVGWRQGIGGDQKEKRVFLLADVEAGHLQDFPYPPLPAEGRDGLLGPCGAANSCWMSAAGGRAKLGVSGSRLGLEVVAEA